MARSPGGRRAVRADPRLYPMACRWWC